VHRILCTLQPRNSTGWKKSEKERAIRRVKNSVEEAQQRDQSHVSIRARGLTPLALENILKAKLKNNYKDESLDVTVAVANSLKDIPEEDLKPKIFITGEVVRPGSYVVRQPTTLMQAIALAGGVSPFAAKRRIQVRRRAAGGDEAIFMFNYKAYEAGADLEGNITLRAGDVIMVPERGLFD